MRSEDEGETFRHQRSSMTRIEKMTKTGGAMRRLMSTAKTTMRPTAPRFDKNSYLRFNHAIGELIFYIFYKQRKYPPSLRTKKKKEWSVL